MYAITVRERFSATHAIKGEKPHAHTFVVEATVTGEVLNSEGVLIDFRYFRSLLRDILTRLDGKDLTVHTAWSGAIPSTEAMAQFIYGELERRIAVPGVELTGVGVAESDDAQVYYGEKRSHD